ncbi:MAG: hypothetical protein ACRDRU_28155, partial [Pseudonocardiaceae bacterium]
GRSCTYPAGSGTEPPRADHGAGFSLHATLRITQRTGVGRRARCGRVVQPLGHRHLGPAPARPSRRRPDRGCGGIGGADGPGRVPGPAGVLAAAKQLADRFAVRAENRWGMSPFAGRGADPVWEVVGTQAFLPPSVRSSPVQAAFAAAYAIPDVHRLAPARPASRPKGSPRRVPAGRGPSLPSPASSSAGRSSSPSSDPHARYTTP